MVCPERGLGEERREQVDRGRGGRRFEGREQSRAFSPPNIPIDIMRGEVEREVKGGERADERADEPTDKDDETQEKRGEEMDSGVTRAKCRETCSLDEIAIFTH
jgi:hypothetical protein